MTAASKKRLAAPLLFAALVAATFAVLWVSQGVRTRLIVDKVELTNELRRGSGQAATIRFRLTKDEVAATVAVIDRHGEVVDVLLSDEPLGDYEIHRLRWDGAGAEPGPYRVRLTLSSLDREIVLSEEIDLRGGTDG